MNEQAKVSTELIDLCTNISLCLNSGYKTLISAKDEMDYRNLLINVHNGVELLMKYYLKTKNEFIIYEKIDRELLLYGHKDLIKPIKESYPVQTIKWFDCINLLRYFSELPDKYLGELNKLNVLSNSRKHFEYYSNHKKTRKLLIVYIFPFIKDLLSELDLSIDNFIKKDYVDTLDKYKKHIDNDIMNKLIEKIAIAEKHYLEELTPEERLQKTKNQDYTISKSDKLIACPACKNDALLSRTLSFMQEDGETASVIKRKVVLREFGCHHCGLSITNYDQLKYEFNEEEEMLPDIVIRSHTEVFNDCPTDCPDDDCDCDCPTDCPDEDCYDCDCDCPSDCPEEDCYDCDCQSDCPEEDCDCPTD